MAKNKLKVLILGGGPSSEHEVSVKTAGMVRRYLNPEKYEAVLEIIPKTGKWSCPGGNGGADIAFIAMHGEFGEDGQIQKILERAGLSYTGSGVSASALGMDKAKSQAIFSLHGLNVPKSFFFSKQEFKDNEDKILKNIKEQFSFLVVIKPADRGSSVGVSVAGKRADLGAAIKKALAVSGNILAQEFIPGTELTCGILDDGKNNLMPLLPTEIVPKTGKFFDYESKYSESGSEEITPARVPADILTEAQDIAVKAHILTGCAGLSRTDMIWEKERGKIYVLEINTLPGLTEASLLPKAALASGIMFPELLNLIINSALVKNA